MGGRGGGRRTPRSPSALGAHPSPKKNTPTSQLRHNRLPCTRLPSTTSHTRLRSPASSLLAQLARPCRRGEHRVHHRRAHPALLQRVDARDCRAARARHLDGPETAESELWGASLRLWQGSSPGPSAPPGACLSAAPSSPRRERSSPRAPNRPRSPEITRDYPRLGAANGLRRERRRDRAGEACAHASVGEGLLSGDRGPSRGRAAARDEPAAAASIN